MKVKSDHRSKFFPIEAIGKKKPEKYQGFNGIRTRELCDTVRCWTNWAVKPHIGSEVNLLSSLGARSICWVKHRTGIVEVTGLNPVEALIFFRLLPSNCWNWKIYCDDHSSLSSLICKQFLNQRLVKLCAKTAICLLTLHWWIYHTLSLIQVLVLFQ